MIDYISKQMLSTICSPIKCMIDEVDHGRYNNIETLISALDKEDNTFQIKTVEACENTIIVTFARIQIVLNDLSGGWVQDYIGQFGSDPSFF